MTLAYKLLGKPQNIEELIEKTKKNKKEHIDVFLRDYYIGLGSFDHYEIKAEAGKIKMRIARFYGYSGMFGMNHLKPAARQGAFIIAIESAKEINKRGLATTVIEESCGYNEINTRKYTIKEAKEELKKQEKFNKAHYGFLNELLNPD